MVARGVAASTSVLFLVMALLSLPYCLSKARGAQGEALTQLKETEPEGLTLRLDVSDLPLVSTRHQYQRLAQDRQEGPESRTHLLITGTLDFTGKWGNVRVSSLGLEKIEFQENDGEWRPVRSLAPTLVSILETLERRRQSIERFDGETLQALSTQPLEVGSSRWMELGAMSGRRYQVLAWYIRSERNEAEVREEYRLTGSLPDRPVDEKGERLLRLQLREGRWVLDSSFP